MDDRRVLGPLRSSLEDPSARVVAAAVEALARLGDETAVVPLLDRISHDVPRVRAAVARSLGRIGDERAVEPLNDLLDDAEPDEVFVQGSARIEAPAKG